MNWLVVVTPTATLTGVTMYTIIIYLFTSSTAHILLLVVNFCYFSFDNSLLFHIVCDLTLFFTVFSYVLFSTTRAGFAFDATQHNRLNNSVELIVGVNVMCFIRVTSFQFTVTHTSTSAESLLFLTHPLCTRVF